MTGYSWTVIGGTIDGVGTNNSVSVTWTSSGSETIRVNYINGNGCTAASPTSKSITVNPLPIPGITGLTPACINSTNTYSTESGMSGYSWDVVGGTINGPTTNNYCFSNLDIFRF